MAGALGVGLYSPPLSGGSLGRKRELGTASISASDPTAPHSLPANGWRRGPTGCLIVPIRYRAPLGHSSINLHAQKIDLRTVPNSASLGEDAA